MEISGHIQNGRVVPEQPLGLPDGAKVMIVIPPQTNSANAVMPAEQRTRYLTALSQIDALENENPGDAFSGASHDQALYGADQ